MKFWEVNLPVPITTKIEDSLFLVQESSSEDTVDDDGEEKGDGEDCAAKGDCHYSQALPLTVSAALTGAFLAVSLF